MSQPAERPPLGVPEPPPMDESLWRFVFQDRDDEEPEEQAEEPCPPTPRKRTRSRG